MRWPKQARPSFDDLAAPAGVAEVLTALFPAGRVPLPAGLSRENREQQAIAERDPVRRLRE